MVNHVTRFVVTLAWLTLGGTVAAIVLGLPRIGWLFLVSCAVFVYSGGCWLLATTCPEQAKGLCALGDMAPKPEEPLPDLLAKARDRFQWASDQLDGSEPIVPYIPNLIQPFRFDPQRNPAYPSDGC